MSGDQPLVTPATHCIRTRFGSFTVAEPCVIDFAAGLPGFEDCRRFVLVASAELAPFSCLQALDRPQPSFLGIDPMLLDSAYPCVLGAKDLARLGANETDTLLWLALVTVAEGDESANLCAPIVINPRLMAGCQIIRDEYPVRLPMSAVLKPNPAPVAGAA